MSRSFETKLNTNINRGPSDHLLDDADLVHRLKSGDDVALAVLMRKYSSKVLSTAFGVLGRVTGSEEVSQDVCFALWRSPDRFDLGKGRLLPWLLIIARSRALDKLRRIRAAAAREHESATETLSSNLSAVRLSSMDHGLMV